MQNWIRYGSNRPINLLLVYSFWHFKCFDGSQFAIEFAFTNSYKEYWYFSSKQECDAVYNELLDRIEKIPSK